MKNDRYHLPYPRRIIPRTIIRSLGRLLLHLFFKLDINGQENFPRKGPLLVVGNHTAAMEAVLLTVFSPWQIEMLSAADIPAERITELASKFYGVIPLHRGSYDRAALSYALSVLAQDGIIGLFPEGGIWEVGKKQAHTGISWLSYRSGAPILPIGFNDTTGALNEGLSLNRPLLTMTVGKTIPAAVIPGNTAKKEFFQDYANQVMKEVHALTPPGTYPTEPAIENERFELNITVTDNKGQDINIPKEITINHPAAIAKFFHRPGILKIFRVNLELPTHPLEHLDAQSQPEKIHQALQEVLRYLKNENPHLLTYRFGIQEGLAMQEGLSSLLKLTRWTAEHHHQIVIQPIRHYHSLPDNKPVTQIKQGVFQSWM